MIFKLRLAYDSQPKIYVRQPSDKCYFIKVSRTYFLISKIQKIRGNSSKKRQNVACFFVMGCSYDWYQKSTLELVISQHTIFQLTSEFGEHGQLRRDKDRVTHATEKQEVWQSQRLINQSGSKFSHETCDKLKGVSNQRHVNSCVQNLKILCVQIWPERAKTFPGLWLVHWSLTYAIV